jgi:hypothetical protein
LAGYVTVYRNAAPQTSLRDEVQKPHFRTALSRRNTEGVIFRLVLLLSCGVLLVAQSRSEWQSCPVIAKMPAEMRSMEPLDQRQRFELRQCKGENVIVTAYEHAKTTPSLAFDTGDNYPRLLAHVETILVFQSISGASDHVYVFVFRAGKPSIALQTATKDLIQIRQSNDAVVVSVPPTTYPGPDGRSVATPAPKEYSFPLDR